LDPAAPSAAPVSIAPANSAPILLKMQAPIESFGRWIDGHLLRWFPVSASFLWFLHLIVALLVTLLMAWLLGAVAHRLGNWAARRGQALLAQILHFIAPTLRWVVLFAGIADAVEDAWPAVKGPARWVAGALFVIATAIGTRGVVRLSRMIIDHVLRPVLSWPEPRPESGGESGEARPDAAAQVTHSPRDAGSATLIALVQRILAMVLWLSGLIVVLDHFGQNISSVIAALGVTSLAISLASQQALSNIIASLVLALDHPFRVGDRVKLPSGDSGEVLEIGMRATQFRMTDGSLLIVPNAELVSSRLVNQTQADAVRAEVRITVPATLDVDRLSERLLEEVHKIEPAPLPRPAPRVNLLSATDKAELAMVFWLPRSPDCDVPGIEERLRRASLKCVQAMLPPPAPPVPPAPTPSGSPSLPAPPAPTPPS